MGFSTLSTASHAAPPLTNCTEPGGVLANGNPTCTFTFTVTTADDSIDTADTQHYVPLVGSLRDAMMNANAWGNYGNRVGGDSVINFALALAGQTITLGYALPMIFSNVAINGPAAGITLDGNATAGSASGRRCFFISGLPIEGSGNAENPNDGPPQPITVALPSLALANCRADGGRGISGGMGAGAEVFVNQQVALTLSRVWFSANRVRGGIGLGDLIIGGVGGGLGGTGIRPGAGVDRWLDDPAATLWTLRQRAHAGAKNSARSDVDIAAAIDALKP